MHFYVRRAPFKLTATPYIEHYSKLLFLVIGLKHPCLFFAISLIRRLTNPNTHEFRWKVSERRWRTIKVAALRSFNLNAVELKGRDVSEGLIGGDTIGKLSGLLPVLSSITYKECKSVMEDRGGLGERIKTIPDDWNIQHLLLISPEPRWEIKICRGKPECVPRDMIKSQRLAGTWSRNKWGVQLVRQRMQIHQTQRSLIVRPMMLLSSSFCYFAS